MIEIEKAFIGSLLCSPELVQEASSHLLPEQFVYPSFAEIYQCILDMHDKGRAIDLVTVGNELNKTGRLEAIGGPMIMSEIAGCRISSKMAIDYAKQIAENSNVKKIKDVARGMIDAAKPEEYLHPLVLAVASRASESTHIAEGISQVTNDALSGKKNRRGVACPGIDVHLHPELTILGATAGCGKSTLALNLLASIAQEKSVVYVTLEDDRHVVQSRLLSHFSGLRLTDIRDCNLSEQYHGEQLRAAAVEVSKLKASICHSPGISQGELTTLLMRLKYIKKADLIIIDYLDRINHGGKPGEYGPQKRTCQLIADTAQKLSIPILLVHHLRKRPKIIGGNDVVGKRPTLDDLRGAGGDEARQVWFLHRGTDPETDTGKGEDLELIVAKNNNGPLGVKKLAYDLGVCKIGGLNACAF